MNRVPRILRLAALAAGLALVPLAAWAAPEPIIVKVFSDEVLFIPQTDYKFAELAVAGPECASLARIIPRGEPIVFRNVDDAGQPRPDGGYSFDVRLTPFIESRRPGEIGGGDPQICRGREDLPGLDVLTAVAYVTIVDGKFVDPDREEDPRAADTQAIFAPSGTVRNITAADQVIPDDLIVQGSLCVGFDCVNNENFSFDTIRLKENNLRIHFDDTSTAAGFPNRDWRIIANDSASGGASKFSIEDTTGARTPFTIEAGAPTNSIFVDDGGRVGFGTAAPVLELHVANGDTPALRLEQTGSSGFTPQTWDIAGNEVNFFVRDVTGGSALPFRIQPGAASNRLFLNANDNVGINTTSPEAPLEVQNSATGLTMLLDAPGDVFFRQRNTTSGQFVDVNLIGDEFRLNFGTGGAGPELVLQNDGDLIITGGYTPDYVFEPDYPLMPLDELAAFIDENKHLPNIPSDAEVKATRQVNVNEFQMRLLEKVEELTLYILEQEQDNRELRERLEKLESAAAPAEVAR